MGIFDKFKIGFQKSASALTSGLKEIIIKKEIDDKILSNPFLESEVTSEILYSSKESVYESKKINSPDAIEGYDQLAEPHQTLREYLMWQIRMSSISKEDEEIAYNIVD